MFLNREPITFASRNAKRAEEKRAEERRARGGSTTESDNSSTNSDISRIPKPTRQRGWLSGRKSLVDCYQQVSNNEFQRPTTAPEAEDSTRSSFGGSPSPAPRRPTFTRKVSPSFEHRLTQWEKDQARRRKLIDTPPLFVRKRDPLPAWAQSKVTPTQELSPPISPQASMQRAVEDVEDNRELWDLEDDFTAQSMQVFTSPMLKVKRATMDKDEAEEDVVQSEEAEQVTPMADGRGSRRDTRHSGALKPENGRQRKSDEDRVKLAKAKEYDADEDEKPANAEKYNSKQQVDEKPAEYDGPKGEEMVHEEVEGNISVGNIHGLRRASVGEVSAILGSPAKKMTPEELQAVADATLTREATAAEREEWAERRSNSSEESLESLRELARLSIVKKSNSAKSKSDIDPEERITAEAKLFDLQDFQDADPLSLPTPKVTGAYVETPAASRGSSRKQRVFTPYYVAGSADRDVTAPDAIREEVEHRVKDSHIEAPATTDRDQAKPEQPEPINTARLTTAAEDLRRLEIAAGLDPTLDEWEMREIFSTPPERSTMPDRLRNAAMGVSQSKKGIERLETQVANMPITCQEEKHTTNVTDADADEAFVTIKIRWPKGWRLGGWLYTPTEDGWKFTWMGLVLVLFMFVWLFGRMIFNQVDVWSGRKMAPVYYQKLWQLKQWSGWNSVFGVRAYRLPG